MIIRIITTVIGAAAMLACLALVNPWLAGATVAAAVAAWGLLSDSEAQ